MKKKKKIREGKMKTLSYEMIVNVAKFLEMKDLVSFSSCGKAYMELCRDDFLYRILYGRDFAKYCPQFSPVLENISSVVFHFMDK